MSRCAGKDDDDNDGGDDGLDDDMDADCWWNVDEDEGIFEEELGGREDNGTLAGVGPSCD